MTNESTNALTEAPRPDAVVAAAPHVHAEHERPAAAPDSDGPDIQASRLDADAVRVVLRLRQNGHQAYLVGGCVRDLLIGLMPKDFDIATSATPNQVKSLFRNCRLIGRRFRLAHVYFKGGKILEVSTFRASPAIVEDPQPSEAAEGEVHADGTEHIAVADAEALAAVELGQEVPTAPVEDLADEALKVAEGAPVEAGVEAPVVAAPVTKSEPDLLITEDNTFGTEVEDATRRDFTVNGLFYDPAVGRVIDYVNGLRDLAAQEIRTIGDPEKRLREDPVRILRAVRFACKTGFDLESRTYAAMEGAVEDLPRCSAPRLLEETFRLIRGGHAAQALRLLDALDALKALLPPVAEYLKEQEPEGVAEYFKFVETMDALVNGGAALDDSMLLASVLLPIAVDEPDAQGAEDGSRPPSVAQAIEALLQELMRKARLPRRIAERCRMMLNNQRTLAGLRRRRGGLSSFRSHPLFNESMRVFEVWVGATGEHQAALDAWKSGGAPVPQPGAEGPRRRRRRRGGAKRNGEAPAGGTPSDAAPAAPPPPSSDA